MKLGHGELSSSSSGWTRYLLEQSDEKKLGLEEGDEDMSMVSDASSGPPHDDGGGNSSCTGGDDIFYSASSSFSSPDDQPPAIFGKEFSSNIIRCSEAVEEDQCNGGLWAVDYDDSCSSTTSTTAVIMSSPKTARSSKCFFAVCCIY